LEYNIEVLIHCKTYDKGISYKQQLPKTIPFGEEKYENIYSSDIIECLRSGFLSPLKFVEYVHFNPTYPEYHNVYMTNHRSKYASIYDGDKWVETSVNVVVDELYDRAFQFIKDNYDKYAYELTSVRKVAMNRLFDTAKDDPKIRRIKKEIQLMLSDNQDTIINKN
jgi:hypothetical protein